MLFRANISNPPLIYEDVTGLVHQCFVDGNRPEAFFVLIYNRIRNACDLRTIINTVGQLLLKLIWYKHRLMLLEPRNYLFFYHVYVGVILCYDLLPKSDLKSCHHPPPTSPTSLVPPHLPKKNQHY